MRHSIITRIALVAAAAALWTGVAAAQSALPPQLPAGADPKDWNAYFDRGVALLRPSPTEADEMFRWASRIDPTRAEPYFGRWVAFHLHDSDRFVRYMEWDESVMRNPAVIAADSFHIRAMVRNPFVHQGLAVLLYDALPGNYGTSMYTRAYLEYAEGTLDKAVYDLKLLIQRQPRMFRAREILAQALVAQGQFDSARVQMDSVVAALRRQDERQLTRVYESKSLLLYGIGLLQLAQNRPAEAREAMAQAVLEDASKWYTHRGLALALTAAGQHAEAVEEYRAALELSAADPVLLQEYGEALSAAGDHAAAIEQLERAVALSPYWAEPWLSLGNAHLRAGNAAGAIGAFNGYLQRAPRSAAETAGRVRASLAQLQQAAGSTAAAPTPRD
ncbi:MAG TPA: tetratricopeptide repeat protein [Longimicrobiaceae bacterium]